MKILMPTAAAREIGLPLVDLVKIIKRYQYQFTEIKPGGKPGDRGRNRWGLTEGQLRTILDGQAREFIVPQAKASEADRTFQLLTGGKSRLKDGPPQVRR